jgi:hypothetical protein
MPLRAINSLSDLRNLAPPGLSPVVGDRVRNFLEPKAKPLPPPDLKTDRNQYFIDASLSNAISMLRRKGISKNNRYIVLVYNTDASLASMNLNKEVAWLESSNCEAAEFPGVQIATQDVTLYAVTEKMPYQVIYDEVTLTYRCDEDMREKKYFDAWINRIRNSVNGNIEYRSKYVASIDLIQLDMVNKDVYGVKLIDAFPTSISSLPMGFDMNNTYHRIAVTFSYKKYVTFGEYAKIPNDVKSAENKATRSLTMFDRALQELGKIGSSYIGTEIVKKAPIGNIPGIGAVSDVSARVFGAF